MLLNYAEGFVPFSRGIPISTEIFSLTATEKKKSSIIRKLLKSGNCKVPFAVATSKHHGLNRFLWFHLVSGNFFEYVSFTFTHYWRYFMEYINNRKFCMMEREEYNVIALQEPVRSWGCWYSLNGLRVWPECLSPIVLHYHKQPTSILIAERDTESGGYRKNQCEKTTRSVGLPSFHPSCIKLL